MASPDQKILNAAIGWLELGNHVEAHNELEKLLHDQRAHPDVLKLHCSIYRQAEKWDYLAVLAESCSKLRPQEARFLTDWAWAEYKQGRKEHALAIMLHQGDKFRETETDEFLYNVSVVLASLGRSAEARDWLAAAFEMASEPGKLKLRALDEAELEKVWRGE